MSRITRYLPLLIVPLLVALVANTPTTAYAHARYEYSDPAAGAMVDATPSIMRAGFTQELTLRSSIAVTDEAGNQVDLADGRVDLDDPNRKVMLVSLPPLPNGVYWVYYNAVSAEDGHEEGGFFSFGVGMTPPIADASTPISPALGATAGCGRSALTTTGDL